MDDREQRQLARNAAKVQNLQLMLLLGMIVGGVAGIIVAAYVILPALGGDNWIGGITALLVIVVGAFLGQRLVLNWAGR